MGNPSQVVDESPAAVQDDDEPDTTVDIQTQIDAAVAAALAEHGIEVPAATTPAPAPSALETLKSLAGDAEDTTFGRKLEQLVEKGIGEAELVADTPTVRALAAIVGELAAKIA